ncbi:SemiSWEET family sugar transporter [Rubritalea tangerina]|uniref:SemiSWEET family sugar transporter n=1 Tax=Rubritalea tangerina TaxID=430798 RepID=A0ABW4ZCX7_9BACT
MTSNELIGYLAGILLALSFLPQVIVTWRTKQADDLSMGMLSLNLSSAILYEIYAWQLGLIPVVIMNGIFCLLVLAVLIMKLLFAPKKASPTTPNRSPKPSSL